MYLHGIEQAEKADALLRNKRIGLVTNYTALDRHMNRSVDLLHEKYQLTRLFSPEHGLYGVAQAGEDVGDEVDNKTGLPVISLYGGDMKKEEWFKKIDVVAFDIQDIGLRFYTYISVLTEVMKQCKLDGLPLVVFDRYNPLGLSKRGGTVLDEKYASFVGMFDLPSRHGLTVGEYALYVNNEKNIGCELTVIPCDGLRRADDHRSLGLPWVYPSPNIPTYETALIYAGTVLFEGTNVSEGRGTTKPFSLIGAPWINGDELVEEVRSLSYPGVCLRSAAFRPAFSDYQGEVCNGIEIIVTDPDAFEPCGFGLSLLDIIRRRYPEFMQRDFLTSLMGTQAFSEKDFTTADFLAKEQEKITLFSQKVLPYQLYS